MDIITESSEMFSPHTPLMKQYHDIKGEYPDALVLFQVGDFYELFYDDAIIASSCLAITLTQRGKNRGEPIPLCGFPLHARDLYIAKLVKGGHKVVICDQLEEPVAGTLVRRGVTQVLTPGTLTDSKLLESKAASYLFVCAPHNQDYGIVSAEFLTAQLVGTCVSRYSEKEVETELIRFFPDEIVVPDTKEGREHEQYFKKLGYYTTAVSLADEQQARHWADRYLAQSSTGAHMPEALYQAMIYFYAYLARNHRHALSLFTSFSFYKPDDFLMLDATTQINLDLVVSRTAEAKNGTLFSILDHAATAMGSRMIKKWLMRPFASRDAIEQRLDMVSFFHGALACSNEIHRLLQSIGDLERVIGRICLVRATLSDYRTLTHALTIIPRIAHSLVHENQHLPAYALIIADVCREFNQLAIFLHNALESDTNSDDTIRSGFDVTLDNLRVTIRSSHEKIVAIEKSEQEKTGIGSLKIRYNGIHGYCIEVTKTHKESIPSSYIRLQTLVGKERFITPELQQLYSELLCAQETVKAHEEAIFTRVKQQVLSASNALRRLAYTLAVCDGLISFALCAYQRRYIRPSITTDGRCFITQGRHPIVEESMTTAFIPNDTVLIDDHSLMIITGPNMGGKSTYLRQVALTCIMAHCGSFVPAQRASISVLDRIFTRIGAGDNLAQGKSTFLVEMEETATICTQATNKSLIILDEVGRGTSTYDGLVIARAVVEYIYTNVRARCLFATHYHELSSLQNEYPGIVSYHVACKKTATGIVFLYRVVPGIAESSFGIDVAHLARLPSAVITRARELLHNLNVHIPKTVPEISSSCSLIQDLLPDNELCDALRSLDLEQLSGRQALELLHEWQAKYGKL